MNVYLHEPRGDPESNCITEECCTRQNSGGLIPLFLILYLLRKRNTNT
ncbi:MAG: hypothetical protein K2L42_02315 [Clostridia bacterium]|nr:hypothetical protein [Clostridia bacterium]